eukprot:1510904-Rhodomonas_salina.1
MYKAQPSPPLKCTRLAVSDGVVGGWSFGTLIRSLPKLSTEVRVHGYAIGIFALLILTTQCCVTRTDNQVHACVSNVKRVGTQVPGIRVPGVPGLLPDVVRAPGLQEVLLASAGVDR